MVLQVPSLRLPNNESIWIITAPTTVQSAHTERAGNERVNQYAMAGGPSLDEPKSEPLAMNRFVSHC